MSFALWFVGACLASTFIHPFVGLLIFILMLRDAAQTHARQIEDGYDPFTMSHTKSQDDE